ncbi:MAG: cache domain-containing protein [Acidobacteria bacterium]|nr:cache domain-containing protein [Acidobacteriota bacterium]
MPQERLEFRVPFRKLLIGLALTLLPVSLAGFYSLNHSQDALEKTIGSHFKAIGESTAAEISQTIHDLVRHVAAIAAGSTVVDAAEAGNRSWQGMPDAAIAGRIQKIDKEWIAGGADAKVKEVLSSAASRSLRRQRELDQRLLRITVTDAKGATIAATHRTLDYYQADEEYWLNIYAQGRGAVSLTDILYDEVTKSSYIGVGVPVLDENARFIGTLDALVDVSSLAPIVTRAQVGRTGRALLVKDDGTVIAAPGVTLDMKIKSDEYAAAQERMTTLQGLQTGYVVSDLRGGARTLIGFADTGLRRDYRNLGWFVLVCQDAYEAFAPIRAVSRLIAFMSLLGLAMVTLLAVYFSLHRTREFEEIGELHHEAAAVLPPANESAETRAGAGDASAPASAAGKR